MIIVSVAVGDRFQPYADRLEASLKKHWKGDRLVYRDLPPDSPTHIESNYGFKVFAIREALKTHSHVLYLDSTLELLRSPQPIFDHIIEDGYFLVPEQRLIKDWTSDEVLEWANVRRSDLQDETIVAGSCIGLSIEHEQGLALYDAWEDCVERGLNKVLWRGDKPTEHSRTISEHGDHISTQDDIKGNIGDEGCLGLVARHHGMTIREMGDYYSFGDNAIIQAKGYDL